MSDFVEPAASISEAWWRTLELVHDRGGRRTNVLTTVTDPMAPEDSDVRVAIDEVLVPGERKSSTLQSVDTVANTIFPRQLYAPPDFSWHPELDQYGAARLDTAAADLYQAYTDMLPLLRTADGNSRGTYFGRMVSWPGKEAGGVNQLAERIKYLRAERRRRRTRYNLSDMAIGGEAEIGVSDATDVDAAGDLGVQVYASTDRRQRGFPCLVHIDFTLLDGKLSMLAVYRHQYLVTKAYGNLLGLSHLLAFVSQQAGFVMGELAVQATMADTEADTFGGRQGIDSLIRSARPRAFSR